MILYPAMDLMDGQCVRLAQGRFDDRTTYSSQPADALEAFAKAGATWAHVVDLDGARARSPRQHDLIAQLAALGLLNLQVAGGIRSRDHVGRLLDAGAERVVIGSLAVQDPDLTRALLEEFGSQRITLALDINMVDGEPQVATSGWTEGSGTGLWNIANMYDACHILITDIARDGMLAGPNLTLVSQAVERLPGWDVQASGGVATAAQLGELQQAGAAGAIVGKALWEGRFTLAEALAHAGA